MLVDEPTLRALLRIGEADHLELEEASGPSLAERVVVYGPEGGERSHIVRRDSDSEQAMNNAAVMEALARAGFPSTPRLVGVHGEATVEEEFQGLPLISLRPDQAVMEVVIDALASFHQLPVGEGLDYEKRPEALLPGAEPPLHRLGFASQEREPALEWFRSAHSALIKTPFGFSHRSLTAANVLAGREEVAIVNFVVAGYGPQLFDVASLLATAGISAEVRRTLAARYARCIGEDEDTIADLVDLATIVWGVESELGLPRRQIEVLGDEAAMERLVLESSRIREAFVEPAGAHPVATAIRRALWPR